MGKILLVEDEHQLSHTISDILELNGFDVISSDNGLQAIDLSSSNKFDLVICDINLPDITGYEVLRSIKEREANATVPFIFLSAFVEEDDIRRGMNMGADDYITKPFSMKGLISTIQSRIAIAEQKKQIEQGLLNQMIFNFVNTNFAHEFFTPLNAIMSLAKIIKEESYLHEDTKQSLDKIYHSGFRIYWNIRLIIMNKVLSNPKTYHRHITNEIDLSNLLKKSISQYFQNSEFSFQIENDILLDCDCDIINLLFEELIYNADKYKKPGTIPTVILQKIGGEIVFQVSNETSEEINIQMHDIKPFKKYFPDLSLNGWGLGLFTVVETCKMMDYNILIDSRNREFIVRIIFSSNNSKYFQ